MNKGKLCLKRYEKTDEITRYEYEVTHNNGGTTLTQHIVVEKPARAVSWTASIELSGLPEQESPNLAAQKLGDWLSRIGSTIKANECFEIPEFGFQDIKD